MKQKKPGIFVQSKTNSAKFWPNSAKIFPQLKILAKQLETIVL